MKAVKLYQPGDLRYEEVEIPQILEDEILVKVNVVGICGSDIPRALVKGAYYAGIILGHEFSGEVVETGAKVVDYKKGDIVTIAPLVPCNKCKYCNQGDFGLCEDYNYYGSRTDGAMAEFVKVHQGNILKVKDNISYEAAAMVDPAANAIHGLWKGNLKKGDTVVVMGLGAIGMFAVQFAKIMGASEVIAVDIFNEKLEIAKKLGANAVFNSLNEEFVNNITDNYKVDLVLDTSGSPIAQNQAVLIGGKKSSVVLLGISNKELVLSAKAVDKFMRYEMNLQGSWNSFSSPFPGREWTFALECMEKGLINVEDIISHKIKLEDMPKFFEEIRDKKVVFNKVLIYPSKN